jgi:hypothetical protein
MASLLGCVRWGGGGGEGGYGLARAGTLGVWPYKKVEEEWPDEGLQHDVSVIRVAVSPLNDKCVAALRATSFFRVPLEGRAYSAGSG